MNRHEIALRAVVWSDHAAQEVAEAMCRLADPYGVRAAVVRDGRSVSYVLEDLAVVCGDECLLCEGTGQVDDPSACGDPEHCSPTFPRPHGCE